MTELAPDIKLTLSKFFPNDPDPDVDEAMIASVQMMLAFLNGGWVPTQRALQPSDHVTGKYDDETVRRVKTFQKDWGLEENGILDTPVWIRLLDTWCTQTGVGNTRPYAS